MEQSETPKPIDLKPCPFCGHHAHEPVQVRGQAWGSYDWEIRCSSSHCCANVRIVADGWERNLDPELNKHLSPDQLYDNRELNLRRMWNRRPYVAAERELEALREAKEEEIRYLESKLKHVEADRDYWHGKLTGITAALTTPEK